MGLGRYVRQVLAERVLRGQALPAGDLGPPGYFGTSPALGAEALDLESARKLLAEAGFPQGFSVQVNGPNDLRALRTSPSRL